MAQQGGSGQFGQVSGPSSVRHEVSHGLHGVHTVFCWRISLSRRCAHGIVQRLHASVACSSIASDTAASSVYSADSAACQLVQLRKVQLHFGRLQRLHASSPYCYFEVMAPRAALEQADVQWHTRKLRPAGQCTATDGMWWGLQRPVLGPSCLAKIVAHRRMQVATTAAASGFADESWRAEGHRTKQINGSNCALGTYDRRHTHTRCK